MITTSILSVILGLFAPVVELLPDISISGALDGTAANTFLDWISLAGYMLPFETFFTIFKIIIGLQVFRIVVSFFKSLLNLFYKFYSSAALFSISAA